MTRPAEDFSVTFKTPGKGNFDVNPCFSDLYLNSFSYKLRCQAKITKPQSDQYILLVTYWAFKSATHNEGWPVMHSPNQLNYSRTSGERNLKEKKKKEHIVMLKVPPVPPISTVSPILALKGSKVRQRKLHSGGLEDREKQSRL